MTNITLVPLADAAVPAVELAADLDRAVDLARQEKAPATRRAYGSDFRIFEAWCAGRGITALPATPETVAALLGSEGERGLKAPTLGRRGPGLPLAHRA